MDADVSARSDALIGIGRIGIDKPLTADFDSGRQVAALDFVIDSGRAAANFSGIVGK